MSELTHYYAVPSRGMMTHWLLEELGVPYRNIRLDLEKQEHKTAEFLSLNPMGRVPVLTHGDVVVTESAAIALYLAEHFPESGLNVAIDSPERGSYLRWMFFAPVSAEPSVLWRALGKVITEVDYKPFAEVEDIAETLSVALRDKEYLVENRFTAVDVMVGSTIRWGTQMMPVLPVRPEFESYLERLDQRPAYQKVNAEHQEILRKHR